MYGLILFVFGLICIEFFTYIKKKSTPTYNKEEILGYRYEIPRENNEPVKVNLYEYKGEGKHGLIVVCHGGSLMNGDADMCDTFCDDLSKDTKSTVVSINYTKMTKDKRPPFQQQEIIDTVEYFLGHNTVYNLNGNIVFVGFSGGAYLQIGAASILSSQYNIKIREQIAFYPLLDDSIINLVENGFMKHHITLVTCDNEQENSRVKVLTDHLDGKGITYDLKEYGDAMQGFIEYNYPEYIDNPQYKMNLRKFDEDQKDMANACYMWLVNQIEGYMNQ